MERRHARRERRGMDEAPTRRKPRASNAPETCAAATTAGDDEDEGQFEEDAALRDRVRERIRQRALEMDTVLPSLSRGSFSTEPLVASLHTDVIETAVQILDKYLTTNHRNNRPFELVLVHRMLKKEAELQTLSEHRFLAITKRGRS